MEGREIYYIDLFDSYRATHISWSELTSMMETHFPSMEIESELNQYDAALESLHLHKLRHTIKSILAEPILTT